MEQGISLKIEDEVTTNDEVHGIININYNDRFDTVVINSQIENSNEFFNYVELNGKKINYPYARISIFKKDLPDEKNITFVAKTKHVPETVSNAKFRVSIIQEHKEITSDIALIKITK
ncbi:MAG: hypothetical protein ACPKPY_12035 [Nitrososphaeraceae archaeon]